MNRLPLLDAELWDRFPDPRQALAEPNGLLAFGGDLSPRRLLAAYSLGIFPWFGEHEPILWWSPDPRCVFHTETLRITRSLHRHLRGKSWRLTVDHAFDQVIRACADPRRPGSWIDRDIIASYTELHRLGWVHSVEAWDGDELAGGLYGVAIGGLFAGESMFHHQTDGSKAAVAGTIELLNDEYAADRVFDIQWVTDHLATLGAVSIPRETYVRRVSAALDVPLPKAFT